MTEGVTSYFYISIGQFCKCLMPMLTVQPFFFGLGNAEGLPFLIKRFIFSVLFLVCLGVLAFVCSQNRGRPSWKKSLQEG